jgi:hypothetical protein
MLVEILEYCLAGESTTAIFANLFLQQLPREIRILLSKDDPADMRTIADKTDWLIGMHILQGRDTCSTVASKTDQDVDLVCGFRSPSYPSSSRRVSGSVAGLTAMF